jgi:hypothetical protein
VINLAESKRICEARTSGLTEDMTEYFNHSVMEYPEALQLLEEAWDFIFEITQYRAEFSDVVERAEKWLKEVE